MRLQVSTMYTLHSLIDCRDLVEQGPTLILHTGGTHESSGEKAFFEDFDPQRVFLSHRLATRSSCRLLAVSHQIAGRLAVD